MYLMPEIPFRKGLEIITLVVRSFFPQMPDRALTRKPPVGIKTRLIRVADRAGGTTDPKRRKAALWGSLAPWGGRPRWFVDQ
ncbi:hypothetical protein GCM10025778_15860 [Paeniglutamicibacter antarcticus]|uniref:Uncharacterized protein n=1 Tax=Paeniglutamicibacter antarcticus TaxID=494023 RepID=A0ABP9TMR4_9MICC